MSKRRYVYRQNEETGEVEAFEVGQDWSPTLTNEGRKSEAEVFGNLQASDGTDISTRKRHREYMQKNGLALTEDYKDTWQQAAKERAECLTSGGGPKERKARREAIERAYFKVFRY